MRLASEDLTWWNWLSEGFETSTILARPSLEVTTINEDFVGRRLRNAGPPENGTGGNARIVRMS